MSETYYNECYIDGVWYHYDLAGKKRNDYNRFPGSASIDYLGKSKIIRINGGQPQTMSHVYHYWERCKYEPDHPVAKFLIQPDWIEKAISILAQPFEGRTKQ
jgi:hypothetical protein